MVFSYSENGPCGANSTDPQNNPNPLGIGTAPTREAHIDELQTAINGWYTGQGLTAPAPGDGGSMNSAEASSLIRAAHINELRVAINRLRTEAAVCENNGPCDCNSNNSTRSWDRSVYFTYTCSPTCDCQCKCTVFMCDCTCNSNRGCNTTVTLRARTTAFNFDNIGTSLTSPPSVAFRNDLNVVREMVNQINDVSAIQGRGVYLNGLTF